MSELFVQVERVEDLTHRMDDYFTQPKQKRKPHTNADRIRSIDAMERVATERSRQIELWGDETHSPFEWAAILGEEYGELCQAINETYLFGQRYPERGGVCNIINEATHVAAVALAIIEAFVKEGET